MRTLTHSHHTHPHLHTLTRSRSLELDKLEAYCARLAEGARPELFDLRVACKAGRPAPMAPDAFEARIREGMESGDVTFTNGKDATEVVIPQYAKGFTRCMAHASKLMYTQLRWADDSLIELAAALQYAAAHGGVEGVEVLGLGSNAFGDAGLIALSSALRCAPGITTLYLDGNDAVTDAGLDALAEALSGPAAAAPSTADSTARGGASSEGGGGGALPRLRELTVDEPKHKGLRKACRARKPRVDLY